MLGAAHASVTGQPLPHRVSTGADDTRYFNLYYNTPATCYGPRGAHLHAADEYVKVAELTKAAESFAGLYTSFARFFAESVAGIK